MSETSAYRLEIISRLRSATEDLAWMVRGLRQDEAHYRPVEGEWTIHENLSHLRDMEQAVYLPLLRWATVPEMLDPLEYNRRAWHESRYQSAEGVASIVDDLFRIREEELGIFQRMDDAVWRRFRDDTQWGPLSCQWIAEVMYRHVLDHMQTIMALRQDLHLSALQPPLALAGVVGTRRA